MDQSSTANVGLSRSDSLAAVIADLNQTLAKSSVNNGKAFLSVTQKDSILSHLQSIFKRCFALRSTFFQKFPYGSQNPEHTSSMLVTFGSLIVEGRVEFLDLNANFTKKSSITKPKTLKKWP